MGLPEDISKAREHVLDARDMLSVIAQKTEQALIFLVRYRKLAAHPELDAELDAWIGGPPGL